MCFQEDLRIEHELSIETAKAEIERDAAVETAKIEAEARIRQERENEDVQTRKLQAQWEADKEKVSFAAELPFGIALRGSPTNLCLPLHRSAKRRWRHSL